MAGLWITATDTEVGKTTFSAYWLTAFPEYDYWKPVETGPSDTELVGRLVPGAQQHPPLAGYAAALAPARAAELEDAKVPGPAQIAAARPRTAAGRRLLVESFGSPFSPLDDELQLEAMLRIRWPILLLASSQIGAIGRTLPCVESLASRGLKPRAVILIGDEDRYATAQISAHCRLPVLAIACPEQYSASGIAQLVAAEHAKFSRLREIVDQVEAVRCEEWTARDKRSVWHPYTSIQQPDDPLVVSAATDEFLELADGRRLIDGFCSWWTIQHGHRNPQLMAALRDAAGRWDHVVFAGATHAPAIELAELMLESVGWNNGRVFYSDDGSTAVEVALKMAYQFWCHQDAHQRKTFVALEGGYHGDTFGAMSVGRDPLFFGRFEPFFFDVELIPVQPESLRQLFATKGDEIAAVIAEPLVQGASGMRMYSPETLSELMWVTRENGSIWIADEVMTGGGRTGTLWASDQAETQPDLICAGKTIAGGVLPIAATLVSERIWSYFDSPDRSKTFFHGHSFTAHPLACAVGVTNWRSLVPGAPGKARVIERFWNANRQRLEQHPLSDAVRVKGSIIAVDLRSEQLGYLSEIGPQLRHAAIDRGVYLRPLGNVLYAMPPLDIGADSLERVLAAMLAAMDQVHSSE